MNFENSKTSDSHRLLLNLKDKINLKRSDKYFALSNFSIYYTWKYIKKWYKNNKFKTSVPRWNEKFSDKSYSVSDIQDYFIYILKNYETVTDNPLIRMYVDKIENKINFTIKIGYLDYLEL